MVIGWNFFFYSALRIQQQQFKLQRKEFHLQTTELENQRKEFHLNRITNVFYKQSEEFQKSVDILEYKSFRNNVYNGLDALDVFIKVSEIGFIRDTDWLNLPDHIDIKQHNYDWTQFDYFYDFMNSSHINRYLRSLENSIDLLQQYLSKNNQYITNTNTNTNTNSDFISQDELFDLYQIAKHNFDLNAQMSLLNTLINGHTEWLRVSTDTSVEVPNRYNIDQMTRKSNQYIKKINICKKKLMELNSKFVNN